MQRAQPPFHRVPGDNVSRISGCALHIDFDPIGSSQFEIPLDDWPREIVHLFERVPFAIVEVSLPMPRRVPTGTCRAENEELLIGRPLGFLNVTSMFTIRRLKVLGRQDGTFQFVTLSSGFLEWRDGVVSVR